MAVRCSTFDSRIAPHRQHIVVIRMTIIGAAEIIEAFEPNFSYYFLIFFRLARTKSTLPRIIVFNSLLKCIFIKIRPIAISEIKFGISHLP